MIYPNPANDFFDVTYTNNLNAIFKLYNSIGEIVLIQNMKKSETKHKVGINSVSNGMYHYVIEFEDKTKAVGKLTIQN